MADRIFPNRYQEEPLDSDLVYQAINWDNFNTKLAEVQNGVNETELPAEFKEVLAKKKSEDMPEDVEEMFKNKNKRDDKDADDLSDVPEQLREFVKKKQDNAKGKKAETCKCGKTPCECDVEKPVKTEEADDKKGKNMKKANTIVFNHPSQLSAEAVESAIAEGDQELANAILAARHERRVRLAGKIETRIAAEAEKSVKLAQRRAYRESLVKMAAQNTKTVRTSNKPQAQPEDGFVKVSQLDNRSKKAFASKAIAQGFPKEYVDAILGESKPVVDNTSQIRNVMSSELTDNVKKAAVSSMVKVATLTDADYSRLVDYWKNELGYGDQEWIDALFTKKYDK
jgi:hypothetical protein